MNYIFTRHWDYWYSVYHIGKYANIHADEVEFYISSQANGEGETFHFDFYSLPALTKMIENNDFISNDNSEYTLFIEKFNALKEGKIDFFIGSLYYQTFNPDLTTCNKALMEGKNILDYKSPSYKPYYAVIFIGEDRSLMPDLIIEWAEKVCTTLFHECFDFQIADIPTIERTLESYNDDGRF